jgi:hypothetical protein
MAASHIHSPLGYSSRSTDSRHPRPDLTTQLISIAQVIGNGDNDSCGDDIANNIGVQQRSRGVISHAGVQSLVFTYIITGRVLSLLNTIAVVLLVIVSLLGI